MNMAEIPENESANTLAATDLGPTNYASNVANAVNASNAANADLAANAENPAANGLPAPGASSRSRGNQP